MKHIAYSFFFILLLSCGSQQPVSQNRITIQFRDSVIKDFYLLAVRDNAVVVSPYTGTAATVAQLSDAAQSVPFEKIEKIVINGNRTFLSVALPAMLGCSVGCGATQNGAPLFSPGGVGPSPSPLQPYVTVGGLIAGYLIGWYATSDKEFTVSNMQDRKILRNFYSLYPGQETPALQKIK